MINAPIERLREGSRYTPWMWVAIGAVIVGLVALGLVAWSWWRAGKFRPAPKPTGPVSEIFGYVREVQPSNTGAYIAVDPAQWFAGQDAIQAATEDKACPVVSSSTPCSLTNGYYIRNNEATTQPLVIAADATVEMQTLSNASDGSNNWDQKISLDQWLQLFATSSQRDWKTTPFIFSQIGGKVTDIREQYVP